MEKELGQLEKNKKIYIVLTYTGTWLSKIVKVYTKKDYSHVSISLDENLDNMYSFGRIHPYNPFSGGFVKESPKYGTFKRFSNTKSKIYSLEVCESQYEKMKKIINDFNENKSSYRFNIIGLIALMFHFKIKRERHFYCAEFVKYVFDNSNLEIDLPELVRPNDFENLDGLSEIYTGILKDYEN